MNGEKGVGGSILVGVVGGCVTSDGRIGSVLGGGVESNDGGVESNGDGVESTGGGVESNGGGVESNRGCGCSCCWGRGEGALYSNLRLYSL